MIILLPLPNKEAPVIYGDKSWKNLRVFSCMKAIKCLENTFFAFLGHMVYIQDKGKEIKDLPQVCDYRMYF